MSVNENDQRNYVKTLIIYTLQINNSFKKVHLQLITCLVVTSGPVFLIYETQLALDYSNPR